jgi:CheY-like chemotaxis protein
MSFMLTEKYDAEVSDVGSGPEAIRKIKEGRKFDLIFVDIRMAPMDGFETCAALSEIDPVTSIVLMTAHADDSHLDRANKLGVEIIDKPLLEETIARIMSGCRRIES